MWRRNSKRFGRGVALASCIAASAVILTAQQSQSKRAADQANLCLDGFCIGQNITDGRFDTADWIAPRDLTKQTCDGVGCKPEVAFRGYTEKDQKALAEALSWVYGLESYNVVTRNTLAVLRRYKYECNASARAPFGQRRFLGIYRSVPSHYVTVVGLRLIQGNLVVYRIARAIPYHTQTELISLAKTIRDEYGNSVLLYDYLTSNAYSDVIKQGTDGWFGRSTTFNSTDLSDNTAELVLIDPRTRSLLEPSSMPESGEIKPLPVRVAEQCSQSLPIQ